MPHNPGDPENTDPEATSADRAEAAAEQAEEAQAAQEAQADASEEAELDPTLDADLEEALADVNADEVEAEAAGEEPAGTGVSDVEAQLAERTEDLQRLNAEYTNYRRRTERDRQAVIETAKAKVSQISCLSLMTWSWLVSTVTWRARSRRLRISSTARWKSTTSLPLVR